MAESPNDETRCTLEPILAQQRIQPHGVMMVLADATLTITHVSANIATLFGIPARDMYGARLAAVVGEACGHRVETVIRAGVLTGFDSLQVRLTVGFVGRAFDCSIQRAGANIIVEFEPRSDPSHADGLDFGRIRRPLARLGQASGVQTLLDETAGVIQDISRFDRVMVYRFSHDWQGTVVAEATSGVDVPIAYHGLLFSAEDVPEQARRLCRVNPLRVIADADAAPAALLAAASEAAIPVDLSAAMLREASPKHLACLRAIGMRALLSIPIVCAGRLWGLITCHHRQAQRLDRATRDACVVIGDEVTRQLESRAEIARRENQLRSHALIDAVEAHLVVTDDVAGALGAHASSLLTLFDAQGCVVQVGGRSEHSGSAPEGEAAADIIAALRRADSNVSASHELGTLVPNRPIGVAGALLVTLGTDAEDYLMLTRSETVEGKRWSGDARTRATEYGGRLNPRESFADWKEVVQGRSRRWSAYDVAGAELLGRKIRERRHARAVEHDARSLRRSNAFLDRIGSVAGIGGWEVDLMTGRQVWSKQTHHILGLPQVPSVDDGLNMFAPEVRATAKAAFERAIATGTGYDLELPVIRGDGARIIVRAVGSVELRDGTPVRMTGALQDITVRVAERAALERANERTRLATGSGGIGIYEWSVASGELVWDESIFRLYGMDPSEPVPQLDQWRRRVHPEDLGPLEAAAARAVETGEPLNAEFRIVWADASVHHLRASGEVVRDDDGRPLRFIGANWDVTESRRLAATLAAERELLHVTLQSIGDGIITTNARAEITWLNPVAEAMTGWTAAEAVGLPVSVVLNIVDESSGESAASPVAACLANGQVSGLAKGTVLISRDGNRSAIEDSAAPIRDAAGVVLGAVLVFHDVTEQRRLSTEATYRASHDLLTGLPNRASFDEILQRSLHAANTDRSRVAILFVDLDQFKAVNDTFGHAAGDRVLQTAAARLKACVRHSDLAARLGGDEFVVVLPNLQDLRGMEIVARKIVAAISRPIVVPELPELQCGVSIGIALYPDDATEAEMLLRYADRAMYRSKRSGGSGFTRFDAGDADDPPGAEPDST